MEIELVSPKEKLDLSSKEAIAKSLPAVLQAIQNDLQSLSTLSGANAGAVREGAEILKTIHEKVDEALAKSNEAHQKALGLQLVQEPLDGRKSIDLTALKSFRDEIDLDRYTFEKDADGDWIKNSFRGRESMLALLSAPDRDPITRIDLVDALDDPSRHALLKWRATHDVLGMMNELMLGRPRQSVEAYLKRGGIKSFKLWKSYEDQTKQMMSLMMDTTTATEGLQWDPTGVGQLIMPEVYPEFGLRRLIQTVPMPRSPYLYPVEPPMFYAKRARQATSDTPASNRNLPPRDLYTRNVTLTAEKLAGIIRHSGELDEDTIVALAMSIMFGLGLSVDASIESCIVNGQKSVISGGVSTFDTGETFDDGSSTLLEDQRICWDGLRYFAYLSGAVEDASTGFLADNLFAIRAKLGRFGKARSQTLWTTGYLGEARIMALKDGNGNPVFLTNEKFGGDGTAKTGTIGRMGGSDIYISNEWPENLNAAGIADGGGGNYTSITLQNLQRLRMGEVRMTRLESTWQGGSAFEQDFTMIRATWRGVFKATVDPSPTEKFIGAIVGIR